MTVELDRESWRGTARPLEGGERERAWATITRLYPFFVDHERKAGRTIPVVALTPATDGRPA